jgi:hypothetical protein
MLLLKHSHLGRLDVRKHSLKWTTQQGAGCMDLPELASRCCWPIIYSHAHVHSSSDFLDCMVATHTELAVVQHALKDPCLALTYSRWTAVFLYP